MDPIYIFGHKNPDTDSVCSAIAYAALKRQLEGDDYRAARLGELNSETRFVLETFDVAVPEYLPHIHLRVQDIMTRDIVCGRSADTVHEVGELIRKHTVHAIPIVDEEGRALGVITERHLARSYLKELEMQNLHQQPTPLSMIAETLDAEIVVGNPDDTVQGDVQIGAMSPESMVDYIAPGDLVILGNRENAQQVALESEISCLIITGGFRPSTRIQQLAEKQGAGVMVTPHDTFAAARLINLSVSVMTLVERNVLKVQPETLVREITQDLLESRLGILLVTEGDGRLVGLITKSDIVAQRRRPVILVDHSEASQSVEGIRQAEIREILDHHRLGGLETAGPMLALLAPVGCTSTLVLRRFREAQVTPSAQIAGLMLAAILSDTMLLKSPTTTEEDREAVDYLGEILGEDPLSFGRRMYNAKFNMAALSAGEIITNDLKRFTFDSHAVAVAQIEVGDKELLLARKEEILQAMRAFREEQKLDLLALMITDIPRGGTELLAVGQTRVVERAFDHPLQENALYLPGVMSRKKQVIPRISHTL